MLSSFGFLSALLVLASVVVVLSIAFGIRMFLFPERSARDRIVDLTGGAREEEPIFQNEQVRGAASAFGKLARPTGSSSRSLERRGGLGSSRPLFRAPLNGRMTCLICSRRQRLNTNGSPLRSCVRSNPCVERLTFRPW